LATSKSAWTGFERVIAADFSEILGRATYRVPLSGVSSRHNGGDVIVPKNADGSLAYDILIECKYRSNNAQHTLFEGAVLDAVGNGVDPKHVLLATKVKRQRGYLVTLDSETFWKLMSLPGALELFANPVRHDGGTENVT
jgi:hypothetical protein